METTSSDKYITTINAGSSSIKLAVFTAGDTPQKVSEAAVENIGQPSALLITNKASEPTNAKNHDDAAALLARWLTEQYPAAAIIAVGHRIVHGGSKYHQSCFATADVLTDLQAVAVFDPVHMPIELRLVETVRRLLPDAQHVLCFDTAFHHDLPARSQLLPIPRRFADAGVRRYGFHGLSYAYILEELKCVEGEAAANGRVIIAHLGSGVSLAAIHHGMPVDTTMSLTPASGVPMSTRSGDVDPGLAPYLARAHGYDAKRFLHMVNFESGLVGISETTADMKKLLEIEAEDQRARDAVDIFCYHITKNIGSLAAALGGLNTLVFTGGMGENAPKIRARVCKGLEFLGITVDDARNRETARLISVDGAPVGVHVIHTDEATTIARETKQIIG